MIEIKDRICRLKAASPEPPLPAKPDVHESNPDTLRDRILLKYLEGELSDEKLDRLLSIVDQQPKEERNSRRDTMP
ncbi:MAG TPA: hypothetical protein VMX56_00525 [Anaerolineales bacterium]|nr:hypothetical protein [Anaerolineales bacterium]